GDLAAGHDEAGTNHREGKEQRHEAHHLPRRVFGRREGERDRLGAGGQIDGEQREITAPHHARLTVHLCAPVLVPVLAHHEMRGRALRTVHRNLHGPGLPPGHRGGGRGRDEGLGRRRRRHRGRV
ncbi:MAG: hypothetical protein ACK55I_01895, partial [bacterium]